jgi:hypothetical protein
MTFDKLADRCLLFVDDDKAMLVELIKEAERELTRSCNILEQETAFTPTGSENGIFTLNTTYKQVIEAKLNGYTLHPISEDEVAWKSDNTVESGDPTGYFVRNNKFHTNLAPQDGDLNISFDATLSPNGGDDPSQHATDLTIPEMYGNDLCNFAVAISSAKQNPGMHDKHWMLWSASIETITNQDADRELIHTIKREV